MSQYYTLGEVLKELRLSQGLSYRDVETQIQIRADYIQALEEARYDALPADIYIRGILKTYASFYHVEVEELLRLYRKDAFLTEPNTLEKKKHVDPSTQAQVLVLSKIAGIISSILIFLGISVFLYQQYSELQKPPYLEVVSPASKIVTARQKDVIITGKTDGTVVLFFNNQKVSLKQDGSFYLPFVLKEGENPIKITARSTRNDQVTEITRTFVYIPPARVLHKLEIYTKDVVVKLKVSSGGKELFVGIKNPNESLLFESAEIFTIESDNPLNTFLRLDGRDLGAMGEERQKKLPSDS